MLPPPVATATLEEVVADSKAGKTADEIIDKIKDTNSRYELTPSQTLDLNKQGVDIKMLEYIYQTNELAKQNTIAEEMNKREQEKRIAQKQLQREPALEQSRYYDDPYYPFYGYYPLYFWGPSFYYRYRR
jgi:hypothetical protein